MNRFLAAIAIVITAPALYLPTRTQAFTWVELPGRSLRMVVTGDGKHTVVFENGAGATLEMWGKVQPAVRKFARTVSYDRAGTGLSDPGPLPRDGRRIAADLRRALHGTGIAPPYILVGASMGGPYVNVFAGMYPEDVSGVVLVDPTVTEELTGTAIPGQLPVSLIDAVSPLEVPFATASIRAMRARNRAGIEADSAAYRAWLASIPNSRLIVTDRSGHNIPIERPDIVIDTIRQMVEHLDRR